MERKYTAVFERDGDFWFARIVEIPGAFTQGRTLEEARENLKEAALLMLECQAEDADESERAEPEALAEEMVLSS